MGASKQSGVIKMVRVICRVGFENRVLGHQSENVAVWMCEKLNKAYKGARTYYWEKINVRSEKK